MLIDECVRELESTPTNRNVTVAETVKDDVAVPLHGVSVYCDNLVERVQCDITTVSLLANGSRHVERGGHAPDVVIAVAQEFTQNVDSHDAQTAVGLNLEDCHYSLVQNRISDVLRGVVVCCDLGKYIIHRLAGFGIITT